MLNSVRSAGFKSSLLKTFFCNVFNLVNSALTSPEALAYFNISSDCFFKLILNRSPVLYCFFKASSFSFPVDDNCPIVFESFLSKLESFI